MNSRWWRIAALVASLCGCLPGCTRPANPRPAPLTDDVVALNNRGVGLMGQYEYGQARDIFKRLSTAHPDRLDLQNNLGIATMHSERDGSTREAQQIFDRVLASDAGNIRAHYNLGLLYLHDGQAAQALPHFSAVAAHDPNDAYAAYFVAQCRSMAGDFAGALASYQQALRVNPHLRSAAYGAFQAMQRLGRSESASMLETFRALESNPQSEVAEFKYTRLGALAEAVTLDRPGPTRVARPEGAVFDPVALHVSPASIRWRPARQDPDHVAPGITAADIDGDGAIDLFMAAAIDDRGVARNAVLLNRGGDGFLFDSRHPLSEVSDVEAAVWGDYDNDGLIDVYLCRRGENQLWRQIEKGRWSNVTVAARAAGDGGTTIDAAMFDADHDGDLDLVLITARGSELLNNNGDGTFRPIGASIGLTSARAPSTGLLIADLDADRDADIVLFGRSAPHIALVNDRMWRYHTDPALAALIRAPISAAIAGDLDADGQPELYTSDAEGIRRWMRQSVAWESQVIGASGMLAGSSQLALADVDGDGRLELIGTNRDRHWQALSISADGRATSMFVSEGSAIATWTVAALDAARGPSVVALPDDGPPLVWRPGTGRFSFSAVVLSGRDPRSRQIRSNTSGIGTQIAARTGSRWTAMSTYRTQSGRGQSLQPLTIGLGGATQIDFVAITWSDGVYQSELALAPGSVRTIGETQRQLSSCPVLFAFDGRRFAFVTDFLGVGGLGTPTSPGMYGPPRPRENILLPDRLLATRRGTYQLKIAEPMEEVSYVDAVRLIAYDVPPEWQLVLDERQDASPPAATGGPRFYRDEQVPVQATLEDGVTREDVTRAVAHVDGSAASPVRIDPRHIGRTDEHTLTLRFDTALDTYSHPMLVADGWIEYPYAQTLFAAWQSRAPYRAPTIEARGRNGRWQVIRREFGYPAGSPRRISVPLDNLPPGTTALRLRGTLELYWDRVAVADAADCPLATKYELSLSSARLTRNGFPRREMHDNRRPSYDDDRRVPFDDIRYARGLYTAEGAVTELLAHEDGALAIFGPGEELQLEFAAAQPPLRRGWTRRFVLETRGWCKDMDLFTKDGDTVEPMPGTRSAAAARLQEKYTTRYQSGR